MYSYYDDWSQPPIDAQELWQGGATKKMPHILNVVSLGKEKGADIVLMVWSFPRPTTHDTWRDSDIDLYVIVVNSHKFYSQPISSTRRLAAG